MDRITVNQQRLAFAKICVENEATMEISRSIEINMGNGSSVSVFVEVPWYLQKCYKCCIFGHLNKAYPSKPVIATQEAKGIAKVWKPKQREAKGNLGVGGTLRTQEAVVVDTKNTITDVKIEVVIKD